MTSEKIAIVLDTIKRYSDFIVTSHIDPDGDAIGCVVAIHLFLKRLKKSSRPLLEDGVGENYRFLDGSEEVLRSVDLPSEVAIVVDSASVERIGKIKSLVERCPIKINIETDVR